MVNDVAIGYAVILTRDVDGEPFFALNGASMPAVFWRRRAALDFRDALKKHGIKAKAVVKVRMTIAIESRG